MELYFYKDWRGNFGDDLNLPFFNAVCPNFSSIVGDRLIGIGTLLSEKTGYIRNSIIFGSGAGQGGDPLIDLKTTRILGVRGPLTEKLLGLDSGKYWIGDPALYLPKIPQLNNGKAVYNAKVTVALHHLTSQFWNFQENFTDSIYFLDPACHSVGDYIKTIIESDFVLCESMHAAIICSAYNIPFKKVSFGTYANDFKWKDFLLTVGIESRVETVVLSQMKISNHIKLLNKIYSFCGPSLRIRPGIRSQLDEVELESIYKKISSLIVRDNWIQPNRTYVVAAQDKIEKAVDGLVELTMN
jgi:succinoglycan biosynthesis protein ExoV